MRVDIWKLRLGEQTMREYLFLVFMFSFILLSTTLISAVDISSNYCYDENTSATNFILSGSLNNTFNYYTNCPFGCNNDTGLCNGTNDSSSNNAMWITYATGSIFLILGTILGIPYGKLTGEEKIKTGFDTTIIIKYMFFFVGLFLMYLSLSMASRNVNIYGGESNILGGINTSVLVIMVTMVLFLFIFIIEILFYFLKNMFTKKQEKTWGERELEPNY